MKAALVRVDWCVVRDLYKRLPSFLGRFFLDSCWGLVEELMKLNRNKLEYYLRGMRAMELILSTF